jgi:hypothetical protein
VRKNSGLAGGSTCISRRLLSHLEKERGFERVGDKGIFLELLQYII